MVHLLENLGAYMSRVGKVPQPVMGEDRDNPYPIWKTWTPPPPAKGGGIHFGGASEDNCKVQTRPGVGE